MRILDKCFESLNSRFESLDFYKWTRVYDI